MRKAVSLAVVSVAVVRVEVGKEAEEALVGKVVVEVMLKGTRYQSKLAAASYRPDRCRSDL